MNKKGLLIALEGIDGSGKSLLAKNLYKSISNNKIDVILTKQPGGTTLGQKLREILHEEKKNVCDLAEFLLFAADRAQHFKEIINPALNQNKIIISDRLSDSSLAYQGYARGIDIEKIKFVNSWAMQNIKPDIIFYIDLDPVKAQERIQKRNLNLTSFEKEKKDFWDKVINGYKQIYKNNKNVFCLDGNKKPEELKNEALKIILEKLNL